MDMRKKRLCILKEYVKRNEINVFSQNFFSRKIVLSLFSQFFLINIFLCFVMYAKKNDVDCFFIQD